MTDSEVFETEIKCIQRRSSGQCNGGSDCCNCDLLMSDEEIISAYERAIEQNDIINRQKAEIAKYNAELEEVNQRADEWHREAELNAAEIIKLQTEKAKFDNTILYDLEQVNKIVETAKVEATKEFAEDVKGEVSSIPQHHFDLENVMWYINKCLKETVGEG